MKRYRFWLLGTLVLVSALLVAATIKTRQQPLYHLARYPKTREFASYIAGVSKEAKTPATRTLIAIHEPSNDDFRDILEYKINADGGFELLVRDHTLSYIVRGQSEKLSALQFAKIKDLVGQLPSSAAPTKREDLLVVFLTQTAPTQLRLYNRRNAPSSIREIARILTQIAEKNPPDSRMSSLPGVPHLDSQLRAPN